jgi:septum formation protein
VQRPTPSDPTPARLVLASASPRRSELLADARVPFEVVVSAVDEQTRPGETPTALVERLAREKCLDVAERLPGDPARPVLGADTIVVAGGQVLGKPRDAAHAVELLSRLVGTTHRVMTAIAVAWTDGRAARSQVVTSRVTMRPATRAELEEYVAVGESLDKAGGYALQGEGARFVTSVEGSRSNVIGLPQEETLALLRASGMTEEWLRR